MDEESPLPILASCSWVQNGSSLKSHLGKDYACGMQSSFELSVPMKSLYFTKHRHAVAQVHVRKGHLYHRLLKNIIRLCVFNAIFIGGKKKKNPEYQKDQGPVSADCSSKEVFSLQKFFQLFSPISFLIAFLFQNKYLKEANLRFRIISYGAQLLWLISFQFIPLLLLFYYSLVIWYCYMKKEKLPLFSLESFAHHSLKLAP